MATSEEWLAKVAHLNIDKASGGLAPHKPLLLLVILELAESGVATQPGLTPHPQTRLSLLHLLEYRRVSAKAVP